MPEVCIRVQIPDSGSLTSGITYYSLTVQGGISPLYAASQNGYTDIVDVLVKVGADVHQVTKVYMLMWNVSTLLWAHCCVGGSAVANYPQ